MSAEIQPPSPRFFSVENVAAAEMLIDNTGVHILALFYGVTSSIYGKS